MPNKELRLFSTKERRRDDVRPAGVLPVCVLGVFVPVVIDHRLSGFICCFGVWGGCWTTDARLDPWSDDKEENALDTRSSRTVRVEEPVDDTDDVETIDRGRERGAWSSFRGRAMFSFSLLLSLLRAAVLLEERRLRAANDDTELFLECDDSLSTLEWRFVLADDDDSCWSHNICSSCFSRRNDDLLRRPYVRREPNIRSRDIYLRAVNKRRL